MKRAACIQLEPDLQRRLMVVVQKAFPGCTCSPALRQPLLVSVNLPQRDSTFAGIFTTHGFRVVWEKNNGAERCGLPGLSAEQVRLQRTGTYAVNRNAGLQDADIFNEF